MPCYRKDDRTMRPMRQGILNLVSNCHTNTIDRNKSPLTISGKVAVGNWA